MNPQDKAKELFNKFIPHTRVFHEVLGWEDYPDSAKQCALITVQEILNSNPNRNPFNTELHSTYPYWEEVMQEIKKL